MHLDSEELSMKKLFFLSNLFFTISLSANDCNPSAVIYHRSSGFGISTNGVKGNLSGSGERSVNLPIKTENGWGCYKKESSFHVEVVKDEKSIVQNFTVSPLKVNFENVPNARAVQYVHFENNRERAYTNKFTLSAFICSGDKLLSVENKQFTLLDLMIKNVNPEVSTSSFFATGTAAKNLNNSNAVTSEHNLFYLLALSHGFVPVDNCRDCEAVEVPAVLSSSQSRSLADISAKMSDFYNTVGDKLNINPCDEKFESLMKSYRLENFEVNNSLKTLKVKKKFLSDKIIFIPGPLYP